MTLKSYPDFIWRVLKKLEVCALTMFRPCNVMCSVGCPKVVQADHGTENCVVAKLQIAF